jgi:hypothetical protein
MIRGVVSGAVILLFVFGAGATASASAGPPSAGEERRPTGAVEPRTALEPRVTGGTPTQRNDRGQFDFRVERVKNCGPTCRDVTLTVVNTGETAVRDVRAVTRIRAGDSVVWQGSESFSKLRPGESRTVTKRVNLGLFEAAQVRLNGGRVTVLTTVTWDSGRETFRERRKVT